MVSTGSAKIGSFDELISWSGLCPASIKWCRVLVFALFVSVSLTGANDFLMQIKATLQSW